MRNLPLSNRNYYTTPEVLKKLKAAPNLKGMSLLAQYPDIPHIQKAYGCRIEYPKKEFNEWLRTLASNEPEEDLTNRAPKQTFMANEMIIWEGMVEGWQLQIVLRAGLNCTDPS